MMMVMVMMMIIMLVVVVMMVMMKRMMAAKHTRYYMQLRLHKPPRLSLNRAKLCPRGEDPQNQTPAKKHQIL